VVVIIVDVDVDVGESSVDIIVVLMMVLSDFPGARMTNFSNRERVAAKIVKTIKEMQMILIQR
jgi:hypothetical protein